MHEVWSVEQEEFKEEVKKKKLNGVGVGMPAYLWLEEFGSQVWSAFGHPPYVVGSALYEKTWRDVDVRLILEDEEYELWGFGKPDNGKLTAFTLAFSELGRKMTGLPIDFQIQRQSEANKKFKGPRSAIGIVAVRTKPSETKPVHDPELVAAMKSFSDARKKQFAEMPKCGLRKKR